MRRSTLIDSASFSKQIIIAMTRTEFHGPTLNYFTLIPALLSGQHTYASLTEITLRIVPVFFGLVLVLMPLLLARWSGQTGRGWLPRALTAISPAFVFYSRYYIPEMLLVCFTFGMIVCGYRYARSKKWIWALRTGVFAALVLRHKRNVRNCLWAAMLALAIVADSYPQRRSPTLNACGKIPFAHLATAAAVAISRMGIFLFFLF